MSKRTDGFDETRKVIAVETMEEGGGTIKSRQTAVWGYNKLGGTAGRRGALKRKSVHRNDVKTVFKKNKAERGGTLRIKV